MNDNTLLEKIQSYGTKTEQQEHLNNSLEMSYKVSSSPRFQKKQAYSPHHASPIDQSEIKYLLGVIDQLQMDLRIQYEENDILKKKYEELYVRVKKQHQQQEQRHYLEQLETTNNQLVQETHLLRRNLQESQLKYNNLQQDFDNLRVNASELLIQNEKLYSLLNSLKDKHSFDIDSQAKHLELISQKKIDDEVQLISKHYKRELDTQNSISENYKKKIDDLINECELKGRKIQLLQEQELKQNLQIELLNSKLQRFGKLEQELIDVETLYQQKSKQCQQQSDDNQTLQEDLKLAKQQIQVLEQNFKQQQYIFENERQELHERINKLTEKETDLMKVNNDFKKKELDQSRLLKKLQDLNDENVKLLEQNTFILDKTNDTESLRVNYKNLVKKYYQMKEQNDYLIQQIKQYSTNQQVLQHQVKLITTEKNELITTLHYTQNQILQQQAYFNKFI